MMIIEQAGFSIVFSLSKIAYQDAQPMSSVYAGWWSLVGMCVPNTLISQATDLPLLDRLTIKLTSPDQT